MELDNEQDDDFIEQAVKNLDLKQAYSEDEGTEEERVKNRKPSKSFGI